MKKLILLFALACLIIPNIFAQTSNTAQNGTVSVNTESDFSVYPNPFVDKVEIALKNNGNKVQVDLFDVLGRVVYTEATTDAQNITIHASGLTGGLYMLKLTIGANVFTSRLVKN